MIIRFDYEQKMKTQIENFQNTKERMDTALNGLAGDDPVMFGRF